jgi:acyl-coenzyme A thioesterase PaaI-like protein
MRGRRESAMTTGAASGHAPCVGRHQTTPLDPDGQCEAASASRPPAGLPNRSEKRGPHLATKRASQWFCPCRTVELKANLLAPAGGDSLVAEGEVVRAGRTLTVCHGDAYAEQGAQRVHVATMLATMVRRRAG